MGRLTIVLSEARHRALEEVASRRGVTIGEVIEESLARCDIGPGPSAEELVDRARAWAGLCPADALRLGVEETRAVRRGSESEGS